MNKKWRERAKEHNSNLGKPVKKNKKLLGYLNKAKDNKDKYIGPPIESDQVKSMIFKKSVLAQRGKWRILPVGIENQPKVNEW